MFYRLKTDLPTFKAGDLFYIDRNGSLRHKDTDIVAYHYSTLEKFPDALEKFWEPVEKPPKRWRAYKGGVLLLCRLWRDGAPRSGRLRTLK